MHTENRLFMLLTGACIVLLTANSFHAFADQKSAEGNCCTQKTMQSKENKSVTTESQTVCNKRSLKNTSKSVALPDEAIEKLTINAGFGWGIFSGNIYNGNRHYSVTQLTISMTPIHDHHMEMSAHEAKEYKIDFNLQPFTKGAISVAIANDDAHAHDFEWKIVQALGRKITDLPDSKY